MELIFLASRRDVHFWSWRRRRASMWLDKLQEEWRDARGDVREHRPAGRPSHAFKAGASHHCTRSVNDIIAIAMQPFLSLFWVLLTTSTSIIAINSYSEINIPAQFHPRHNLMFMHAFMGLEGNGSRNESMDRGPSLWGAQCQQPIHSGVGLMPPFSEIWVELMASRQ